MRHTAESRTNGEGKIRRQRPGKILKCPTVAESVNDCVTHCNSRTDFKRRTAASAQPAQYEQQNNGDLPAVIEDKQRGAKQPHAKQKEKRDGAICVAMISGQNNRGRAKPVACRRQKSHLLSRNNAINRKAVPASNKANGARKRIRNGIPVASAPRTSNDSNSLMNGGDFATGWRDSTQSNRARGLVWHDLSQSSMSPLPLVKATRSMRSTVPITIAVQNTVELIYRPPFLWLGPVVTLISCAIFSFSLWQ